MWPWANITAPAPIFEYGIFLAEPGWPQIRYLVSVLLLCVGIEGAIYHYLGDIKHPYGASGAANLISTALGCLYGMVGAMFKSWFIVPTLLSILIEAAFVRFFFYDKEWPFYHVDIPVAAANFLTNSLIAAYIAYFS